MAQHLPFFFFFFFFERLDLFLLIASGTEILRPVSLKFIFFLATMRFHCHRSEIGICLYLYLVRGYRTTLGIVLQSDLKSNTYILRTIFVTYTRYLGIWLLLLHIISAAADCIAIRTISKSPFIFAVFA